MDDSPVANNGAKDILLVKCKQTIEELNMELEQEKRLRAHAEDSITNLELTINEKEAALRENVSRNEKLAGIQRIMWIS